MLLLPKTDLMSPEISFRNFVSVLVSSTSLKTKIEHILEKLQ